MMIGIPNNNNDDDFDNDYTFRLMQVMFSLLVMMKLIIMIATMNIAMMLIKIVITIMTITIIIEKGDNSNRTGRHYLILLETRPSHDYDPASVTK